MRSRLPYNSGMHRGLICVLLACLIGLAICHPAIERVDCWDNFPQTGDETELNLMGIISLFGIALLLKLIAQLVSALVLVGLTPPTTSASAMLLRAPADALIGSPPLICPLRI